MRRRLTRSWEQFENRLAMTVTAAVSVDDLVISGTADGAVEILAVDADTYQISDNGVVVSTLDGITDDIRIVLNKQSLAGGNQVTIDLGGNTVDSIMATLGNGESVFTLSNGTARSLRYIGGSGADAVELSDTFAIESTNARFCGVSTTIALGNGDNTLALNGAIAGSAAVASGSGADKVTVGETAVISSALAAALGSGDDSFTLDGEVTGALCVLGGEGADTVTVSQTGSAGSALLTLGNGENAFTLLGSLGGALNYQGGSGSDTVDIGESALVGGTAKIALGAGDNTVTLAGSIGGDFIVRSANAADVVTITDTAVVSGTTDSQPGVETFGRVPKFGHGAPKGRGRR